MTIETTLYDTRTLLGVAEHLPPVNTYWTQLAFGNTILSNEKYIDFEKTFENRVAAPLVMPHIDGKPIFARSSKVQRYEPAYIKMTDTLEPSKYIYKLPGELAIPNQLSPLQRKDREVARIIQVHREAKARKIEAICAEVIRNAVIILEDEGYPRTDAIAFHRDPSHNIILAPGSMWTDPNTNPLKDINAWTRIMQNARHGGIPNRITFGPDAWDAFSSHPEVKATLDLQMRNSAGNYQWALTTQDDVQFKGNINGMDLYVYVGYYEKMDSLGNIEVVRYMESNEIIMTCSGEIGVLAYGMIQHMESLVPSEHFIHMYSSNDKRNIFLESESAPLPILTMPNKTLRAVVVA